MCTGTRSDREASRAAIKVNPAFDRRSEQTEQRRGEEPEWLSVKEEPLGKQDTYYVKKLQDVHKSVKKSTSLGLVADGLRLLFQPGGEGGTRLTLSPSS